MKNPFKLTFALLLGAMLFAACSDDDSENLPEQKEVTTDIVMVTDSTVSVRCVYCPSVSSTYQLRIENTLTKKYSEEVRLKIRYLLPGRNYTIQVTTYDDNQKAVGRSEVKFSTPHTGDDLLIDGAAAPRPIVIEEG